jgi:hypothetical protein
VVEQLLDAGAATATENEHTLIGMAALTSGPVCVVVFVPSSCPGREADCR